MLGGGDIECEPPVIRVCRVGEPTVTRGGELAPTRRGGEAALTRGGEAARFLGGGPNFGSVAALRDPPDNTLLGKVRVDAVKLRAMGD